MTATTKTAMYTAMYRLVEVAILTMVNDLANLG
jgi:hypothetical protein